MNSTQTRHTVPVKKANRTLIGTGVDKTLAHVLDSTFVFKAKQSGKVVHYDENSKLMILQYKDGSKDVIDLREKLDKNGGGDIRLPKRILIAGSYQQLFTLIYKKWLS